MRQAQINVRTRARSRTSIARTKQAALTHNVRGKELIKSMVETHLSKNIHIDCHISKLLISTTVLHGYLTVWFSASADIFSLQSTGNSNHPRTTPTETSQDICCQNKNVNILKSAHTRYIQRISSCVDGPSL